MDTIVHRNVFLLWRTMKEIIDTFLDSSNYLFLIDYCNVITFLHHNFIHLFLTCLSGFDIDIRKIKTSQRCLVLFQHGKRVEEEKKNCGVTHPLSHAVLLWIMLMTAIKFYRPVDVKFSDHDSFSRPQEFPLLKDNQLSIRIAPLCKGFFFSPSW